MFYYYNGRLPLTNGLLPVADGKTKSDSEKISLKTLYEMLKDTKSHGLASLLVYRHLTVFLVVTLVCQEIQ